MPVEYKIDRREEQPEKKDYDALKNPDKVPPFGSDEFLEIHGPLSYERLLAAQAHSGD